MRMLRNEQSCLPIIVLQMDLLATASFLYVPAACLGNYSWGPLLSGTVPPASVLDTSQDGVFCLVTLDDECFHSCEQNMLAKELGLLEKAAGPGCWCLNEGRKRTGISLGSTEAVLWKSNIVNFCRYPRQTIGLETYQTIKLKWIKPACPAPWGQYWKHVSQPHYIFVRHADRHTWSSLQLGVRHGDKDMEVLED